MTAPPALSIVIPAFNEATRVGATLDAMRVYFHATALDAEVIVIDDGSTDATVAVARAHGGNELRLISHPSNRGKGAAVRTGVAAARASVVVTCDADLATPIEELPRFLAALATGADIAVGSRHIEGSRIARPQPWARRMLGGAFRSAVRVALRLPVDDAMCGFKVYRVDAARWLFARSVIDDYAFDIEVMHLARGRFRIVELPVRWRHVDGSKVELRSAVWRAARDVVRITARSLKR